MDTIKQAWLERCTRRLTELQPLLRPRIAQVVAEELWRGERGHIPPEEWAEIEVLTWGRRKPSEAPQLGRRRPA